MNLLIKIMFWISAIIIFWAMIGYPVSLKVISKIYKNRNLIRNYKYVPKVSVMIVAHNEEKVIVEKLNNVIRNDYPVDKIEYIVASDYSTDKTNSLVEEFIKEHPDISMQLYCAKAHKGKTNAQNEAQKIATGEILVMTDANAMFEKNAISELIAAFSSEEIVYVAGKLIYKNAGSNDTAATESAYWDGDLNQREIESNIQTITAGNGAIYAVRNAMYYDFSPIKCHDSCMPYYYGKLKKRAIYTPYAVAYEKAGEIIQDEYKRKVRMNRIILTAIKEGMLCLNVFKYGWFSYFYFGHRTCRYLLWLAHTLLYAISFVLSFNHWIYFLAFVGQSLFYVLAIVGKICSIKNKYVSLITYYAMTILAQWHGVINIITGKTKPTWESAETTR